MNYTLQTKGVNCLAMFRIFIIASLILQSFACGKKSAGPVVPVTDSVTFLSAVDLSSYPEIAAANIRFYTANGVEKEMLSQLKENGVNAVRLKLWVNPANQFSGFDAVKQFAQSLHAKGFKVWLTVHYSDTWADPGQQQTPQRWQSLGIAALSDTVANYTRRIITDIKPDIIQIGNEINTGFLHPLGHITSNYQNFIALLNRAASTVRTTSPTTKIMIHFAGIDAADWFFDQVKTVDYDIIGLSYYPIWHGKSFTALKNRMQQLSNGYNKQVVIAETAYPFTLSWNDWTNNIVGLTEQLILPDYPATPDGQKAFLRKVRTTVQEVPKGYGFCYWGGELVAWKGTQATNGSPWENQALFDFQYKALPVLQEFKVQ